MEWPRAVCASVWLSLTFLGKEEIFSYIKRQEGGIFHTEALGLEAALDSTLYCTW